VQNVYHHGAEDNLEIRDQTTTRICSCKMVLINSIFHCDISQFFTHENNEQIVDSYTLSVLAKYATNPGKRSLRL
jgi:hypothetical protein